MNRKKTDRFNLRSIARHVVFATAVAALASTSFAGTAGAIAKPKQALASVTIGAASTSVVDMPIWVAQADGYFAQHGIVAKSVVLSSSTLLGALISGSIQYCTASPTTFLQSQLAGGPVEAIANPVLGLALGLVVSTAFATAHGITAKTPFATVAKDMIGSTGGSAAASLTGAIGLALKENGVDLSQVHVATFSSTPAMLAAVQSGQVSWAASSEPAPLQLQGQGYGIVAGSPANILAWSAKRVGIGQVIAVANSFATANPGLTRNVLRSLQDAVTQIGHHELKVLSIAQANLPGVTRPELLKTLSLATWPTSILMNGNRWRTSLAFLIKSGSLPSGSKATEGVAWTNKYLP